jgi:hypothetical protein
MGSYYEDIHYGAQMAAQKEAQMVAQKEAQIAAQRDAQKKAQMAAQMLAEKEAQLIADKKAQKKSVCDFFNSLDDYYVRRLKETKKLFTNYEQFDEKTIFDTMDLKKKTEKELKSIFTIREDTKKRLNSEVELLIDKASNTYSANTFVEDLYKTYARHMGINTREDENIKDYKKIFPISEFFSYLVNCEKVVDTNNVVLNVTTGVAKGVSNGVAEDSRMKNKYLKYKQKYLSLKNKIN